MFTSLRGVPANVAPGGDASASCPGSAAPGAEKGQLLRVAQATTTHTAASGGFPAPGPACRHAAS